MYKNVYAYVLNKLIIIIIIIIIQRLEVGPIDFVSSLKHVS